MCVVHNLRNLAERSNITCLLLTSIISSRVRSGSSCRCMFGGSGGFMLRNVNVPCRYYHLVVPIASVVSFIEWSNSRTSRWLTLRTAARVQSIAMKSLGIYRVTKWSLWDDRLSLEYTQVYRWRVVTSTNKWIHGVFVSKQEPRPRVPYRIWCERYAPAFSKPYGIGTSSFRVRRCQVGIDIVWCIMI